MGKLRADFQLTTFHPSLQTQIWPVHQSKRLKLKPMSRRKSQHIKERNATLFALLLVPSLYQRLPSDLAFLALLHDRTPTKRTKLHESSAAYKLRSQKSRSRKLNLTASLVLRWVDHWRIPRAVCFAFCSHSARTFLKPQACSARCDLWGKIDLGLLACSGRCSKLQLKCIEAVPHAKHLPIADINRLVARLSLAGVRKLHRCSRWYPLLPTNS